jgi:hypothetical protein
MVSDVDVCPLGRDPVWTCNWVQTLQSNNFPEDGGSMFLRNVDT